MSEDRAPSLRLYRAAASGARVTFVLAHGAGAGHDSAFLVTFASALSSRGIDVCTFNFPYIDRGRRLPDSRDVLETCLRAAVSSALSLDALRGNRLVIGGKSMGGRMASYLAADAAFVEALDLRGLVCLGYPLHPPGKPQQLRASHLRDLRVPTLIVQGTRDTFGAPDDLRPHLDGASVPVTVHEVAGGDHSFSVRKRDGGDPARTMADVEDTVVRWMTAR